MSVPAKSVPAGQPSLRLVTPEGGAAAGPGTDAGPAPLTPAHLMQLREAEKRSKKIRRAAGVAAFGGWSAAIFAGISAVLSLLPPDVVGLVLAAALGLAAYHELTGRRELLRFEARASRRLGLNQLCLAAMIVIYGSWKLWGVINNGAPIPPQASTGDAEMDQMIADMTGKMMIAVYAGVIAAGLLVPGLTAIYYFTRGRLVRQFVATTPGWVLELMRARV